MSEETEPVYKVYHGSANAESEKLKFLDHFDPETGLKKSGQQLRRERRKKRKGKP